MHLSEGEEYALQSADSLHYDAEVDASVIAWRVECFQEYGFTHADALALAVRRDVDRERVRLMRAAGALPHTIMRILRPA